MTHTEKALSFIEDLNAQFADVYYKYQRGEMSDRQFERVAEQIEALRERARRLQ